MKLEENIFPELKADSIPDTQQLQKDLLLSIGNQSQEMYISTYNSLQSQPRLVKLPAKDAREVYEKVVPLSNSFSWTDSTPWLTTEINYQKILAILDKHQIPIRLEPPCNIPRPISECQHSERGIFIPYAFSDSGMGDGHVLYHINLIPYQAQLFSVPFAIVEKSTIKDILDSREEHDASCWIQQESVIKKSKFERRSFVFCEQHLETSKKHLQKDFSTKDRQRIGTNILLVPDRYCKKLGESVREVVSVKTAVIPMGDPTMIYDPKWIQV